VEVTGEGVTDNRSQNVEVLAVLESNDEARSLKVFVAAVRADLPGIVEKAVG
jgi:hypothetical protein